MTTTPVILQSGIQLGASAGVIVPAVTAQTQITSAVFTSTDTVVDQLYVYLVRSGGAPGPGNLIIGGATLPPSPNPGYVSPELRGQNLNVGDSLYGYATNGGVVNCVVNGVTF